MTTELLPFPSPSALTLPTLITHAGEKAARSFLEFFVAHIRNANTRQAYARAVGAFLSWAEERNLTLSQLEPLHVAAYIETHRGAPQTVKQHLAAIRMLFDWLVVAQVVPLNPASSVRGPRYSYKKGKTPCLSAEEVRLLLDSIDTSTIGGKRDKALLALMVFSFARIGAVVAMSAEDYFQNGKRCWVRLYEKGGKYHELPVHHTAEEYLDDYISASGVEKDRKRPLFRSTHGRSQNLSENALRRGDVLAMIKRRAGRCGLSPKISCHSFRASGITNYLENGGSLEFAAQIAAHESPRTTKLYDRRSDAVSLDEVERIRI